MRHLKSTCANIRKSSIKLNMKIREGYLEKIRENVAIAFVEDSVGFLEHQVEVPHRVR